MYFQEYHCNKGNWYLPLHLGNKKIKRIAAGHIMAVEHPPPPPIPQQSPSPIFAKFCLKYLAVVYFNQLMGAVCT